MTVKEFISRKVEPKALNKLIVLFFYSNRDEQKIALHTENLLSSYTQAGKMHFFSIDANLHPELTKSFNVKRFPKLILIFEDKEIGRFAQESINETLIEQIIQDLKTKNILQ